VADAERNVHMTGGVSKRGGIGSPLLCDTVSVRLSLGWKLLNLQEGCGSKPLNFRGQSLQDVLAH
jgi:hypothetical protein